ncbi:glycosyltransferase family 39 protein [Candidatus Daviesbacteria bacterium]|nr:glycosyltransferase family 39 protein [Candidatus Daviesbacteria bacterium]
MHTLINRKTFILVLIILAGALFRFFRLGEYPIQLNHDEISQLYDIRSILETKKDIYGNFLPLAFPSTGDYKVGHYIYISTIPYLIFGNQEATIRIPAAFFGTLTILAVFLFVKILTKNWLLAILSATVTVFTPSEIFYSRKSFENVIGSSLDLFGLFFLLKHLKEGAGRGWAILGVFVLVIAMYIYTSQTILIPLLMLLLIILFRKKILEQRKDFLLIFVLWIIFVIPLIIITTVNPSLRFRAQSVFINQDVNLGKVINLNANELKSYIDFIPAKLLYQFDPDYLFLDGLDLTNQNAFDIGPLLIWQFPFLILGIIFLIKNGEFSTARKLLFGLTILAMIPSAVTFEDFSPHRSILSFTMMSIISAFGLYWLVRIIFRFGNLSLKILILTIIFTSLILNIVYFIRMYIVSYPHERSEKLQYPFKEVSLYIWSEYNNFDQIIFDPKFGDTTPIIGVGTAYYLAYYGNYPPDKLQKELHSGNKPREVIFDKFSIREVFWPADKDLKNTLIIVSPWSIPEHDIKDKSRIIRRFYFYNGALAFYAIRL